MLDKRLLKAVPQTKPLIMRKIICNWLALLCSIGFYVLIGYIFSRILADNATIQLLWPIIAAIGLLIVRFALMRLAATLSHKTSAIVKHQLRSQIYNKLRQLGSGYQAHFKTSELSQLATEGVEQLEIYFANYIPQFIYAFLAPLTLFIIYLPLSWQTALVLFICVPLIPVSIIAVQKFAKKLLAKYWGKYTALADSFLENLQGLTTLKVYSADQKKHQEMNDNAENFRKVTMKVLTMQLNSVTVMDIVAYGGTAVGTIFCGLALANQQISLPQALFMILLASEFFLAMRLLGSYFHIAMNGVAAAERMFRLFAIEQSCKGSVSAANGDISINNLDFSYGEKQVIFDFKAEIKQGDFVAIVGESGCGKSTLAKILNGSLAGYSGQVSVNGLELGEISNLNQLITTVSLASYIFQGTVRDNLLLADPTASEEQLLTALKKVNLLDFVQANGGLGMPLYERGANLSGGQRQRLALARALLKPSSIYIFDEATSNIDVESEEQILQAILALKGKHTIIMISHRLQNVIKAEQIFLLEYGRLAEQGNHRQLIALGGKYSKLYSTQQELENISKAGEHKCVAAV